MITLKFALAYDIEYEATCSHDYGYLEVNDGTNWVTVTPTPGYDYDTRWCGQNSPINWTIFLLTYQARRGEIIVFKYNFF